MLAFHLLSIGFSSAIAIWLWHDGRVRSRLSQALYGLIAWDLLRLLIIHLLLNLSETAEIQIHGVSQAVAWAILLWSLRLDWPVIALATVAAAVLTWFLPNPTGDALSWGLLATVPLISFLLVRQRTLNVPILPNSRLSRPVKKRNIIGNLNQEAIETQQPILECITDGVIVFGNEGVVKYANQAAGAAFGETAEDLIGRPSAELLARLPIPGGGSAPSENGRSTLQAKFELNDRMLQGQMNIVYDQAGAVQGTVAILQDITAEAQSERAKNAFLTTISHELRTPLTAIKGYVELLNGDMSNNLDANQKMFLGTIQRNVSRMVQLINSLIFASAVKGGRVELKLGYADLRQLIQQIVREKQDLANEQDQRFELDLDGHLYPIQADPIHIYTILQELISNSIKYNRPEGKVNIHAALELDEQQEAFALISIQDEGIGIDKSAQGHIFEEFFRPDLSDTQVRAGGVGMGLSIVRALVEAYNGRIWFESQPGEGSTFTFIIPTKQPDEMALFWDEE